MTIVRDGGRLTLINTVRLNDAGLAELEKLGTVTNVVRIGDMHGVDDPFYVDRYGAKFWAMPGMGIQWGLTVGQELEEGEGDVQRIGQGERAKRVRQAHGTPPGGRGNVMRDECCVKRADATNVGAVASRPPDAVASWPA
jgi:hypothetical protein